MNSTLTTFEKNDSSITNTEITSHNSFGSNISLVTFGLIVFSMNFVFLYAMFHRRRALRGKRYVFLANLAVADCGAGLVLVCLSTADWLGLSGSIIFMCLLHAESCLSLCLTMFNYTCSVGVQFIAVRYPIYYKTRLTRTRTIFVVILSWLFSLSIALTKLVLLVQFFGSSEATTTNEEANSTYIFPYVDLSLKCTYMILNCFCFLYVLIVAVKRRKNEQQRLCSMGSSTEERDYCHVGGANNENGAKKRALAAYMRHYQAVLTAGLRLCVYTFTCTPLIVYSALALWKAEKSDDTGVTAMKAYAAVDDVGVPILLLWFCRAIVDPLITLIREKRVLLLIDSGRRSNANSSTNSGQKTSVTRIG